MYSHGDTKITEKKGRIKMAGNEFNIAEVHGAKHSFGVGFGGVGTGSVAQNFNFDFSRTDDGSHLNKKLAEQNPMIAAGLTNVTTHT